MVVKKQKKIEFINDCGCVVDYGELEKAILFRCDKPTARLKHIYLHGNYPAVTIHKEKIHVHRLLMMYWIGNEIPTNYSVHHLDGNKLNSIQENLSIVLNSAHLSGHNKGRQLSDEHRVKISENNHKRKGIRHRKTRDDVTYESVINLSKKGFSINKIASILNCDWTTVVARLNEPDNPGLMEG